MDVERIDYTSQHLDLRVLVQERQFVMHSFEKRETKCRKARSKISHLCRRTEYWCSS